MVNRVGGSAPARGTEAEEWECQPNNAFHGRTSPSRDPGRNFGEYEGKANESYHGIQGRGSYRYKETEKRKLSVLGAAWSCGRAFQSDHTPLVVNR